MDTSRIETLRRCARQFGTPSYVYFMADSHARVEELKRVFGNRFEVSFAVKSNPNLGVLRHLLGRVDTFDVSSFAEAQRVLAIGARPEDITFSGPGKREEELRRAVQAGVGEIVCESVDEAVSVDRYASRYERKAGILVRINPLRAPKNFSVNMAGKPSQFGIDEEEMEAALATISRLENTELLGFHIYAGTNGLNAEAIVENFCNFMDLFDRASRLIDCKPRKLIFGSGFGIPYLPDDHELDVRAIAAAINPRLDAFRSQPRYENTRCVLEMGRWLIGRAGYLLTSVVREKTSRGTEFRICDAGFNNQLVACGMMGTVIRRNWRISKVSAPAKEAEEERTYTLTGPLCTTVDLIANNIQLPELHRGDVLVVEGSGAYGFTASPTRFISHPEPREILVTAAGDIVDVSETLLNHWDRPLEGPKAAIGNTREAVNSEYLGESNGRR
jgi:diaminopimelate decarboxylase